MEGDAKITPTPLCSAPPHSEAQPHLLPLSSGSPSCDDGKNPANRRSGRIQGVKEKTQKKQEPKDRVAAQRPSRLNTSPTKRERESGMVQVSQSLSVKLIRLNDTQKQQKLKKTGLDLTVASEYETDGDKDQISTSNEVTISTPIQNSDENTAERSGQDFHNNQSDMDKEGELAAVQTPETPPPIKGWVIGPLFQTFKSKMASFTEIVMSPTRLFKPNGYLPASSDPEFLTRCQLDPVQILNGEHSESKETVDTQGQMDMVDVKEDNKAQRDSGLSQRLDEPDGDISYAALQPHQGALGIRPTSSTAQEDHFKTGKGHHTAVHKRSVTKRLKFNMDLKANIAQEEEECASERKQTSNVMPPGDERSVNHTPMLTIEERETTNIDSIPSCQCSTLLQRGIMRSSESTEPDSNSRIPAVDDGICELNGKKLAPQNDIKTIICDSNDNGTSSPLSSVYYTPPDSLCLAGDANKKVVRLPGYCPPKSVRKSPRKTTKDNVTVSKAAQKKCDPDCQSLQKQIDEGNGEQSHVAGSALRAKEGKGRLRMATLKAMGRDPETRQRVKRIRVEKWENGEKKDDMAQVGLTSCSITLVKHKGGGEIVQPKIRRNRGSKSQDLKSLELPCVNLSSSNTSIDMVATQKPTGPVMEDVREIRRGRKGRPKRNHSLITEATLSMEESVDPSVTMIHSSLYSHDGLCESSSGGDGKGKVSTLSYVEHNPLPRNKKQKKYSNFVCLSESYTVYNVDLETTMTTTLKKEEPQSEITAQNLDTEDHRPQTASQKYVCKKRKVSPMVEVEPFENQRKCLKFNKIASEDSRPPRRPRKSPKQKKSTPSHKLGTSLEPTDVSGNLLHNGSNGSSGTDGIPVAERFKNTQEPKRVMGGSLAEDNDEKIPEILSMELDQIPIQEEQSNVSLLLQADQKYFVRLIKHEEKKVEEVRKGVPSETRQKTRGAREKPKKAEKKRRKPRPLFLKRAEEQDEDQLDLARAGVHTADDSPRRLLRSYSCPEIPSFLRHDTAGNTSLSSPQHGRIVSSHRHHSPYIPPVPPPPSSFRRARRHTVCSVEVEREIAPLCLRKEVYPTRRSSPCDNLSHHVSPNVSMSPSTSLAARASCFLSSPLAFLSWKLGKGSFATSSSASSHVTTSSSPSIFPTPSSPSGSSVRHALSGSPSCVLPRADLSSASVSSLCSALSQIPLEGESESRQQSEEEEDGEDGSCFTHEFEAMGMREEKALSDSEIKLYSSKHEERGKVSSIRIRKALPKPRYNLTPMGLPKAIRVKKKEFSLEEIYTNKNFTKPSEARLETIYEVPQNRRNGSQFFIGQKRMKRFVEFPEVGVARKPRKPLVGAGKLGITSALGRPRRGGFPNSKDGPSLNLQELDSLLCSKLDQLDSWLAFDQEMC